LPDDAPIPSLLAVRQLSDDRLGLDAVLLAKRVAIPNADIENPGGLGGARCRRRCGGPHGGLRRCKRGMPG